MNDDTRAVIVEGRWRDDGADTHPTHHPQPSSKAVPAARDGVPPEPPINSDGEQGQAGYGEPTDRRWRQRDYHHPAAGWGAALSVGKVLVREREPIAGTVAMLKMNQERHGFDCPGCGRRSCAERP